MNQKNHNAIAKIIKNNTAPTKEQFNDLSIVGECLIDDLADYLEKEERKELEILRKDGTIKAEVLQLEKRRLDNRRRQFIKNCEVEE